MAKGLSRRQLLGIGAGSLAAGVAWTKEGGAKGQYQPAAAPPKSPGAGRTGRRATAAGRSTSRRCRRDCPASTTSRSIVPNGAALPFKVVDGVKVFHVIAEEVDHAFDSGLRAKCWGYNGRVNSTVIEAVEGERIRIYVTNRLAGADLDPLAWLLSPQRDGRRRGPDAAVHQGRERRPSTSGRSGSTAASCSTPITTR